LDLCFLCFFSLFLLALGSPIEDATRLGTRPGRDCAALGLACGTEGTELKVWFTRPTQTGGEDWSFGGLCWLWDPRLAVRGGGKQSEPA